MEVESQRETCEVSGALVAIADCKIYATTLAQGSTSQVYREGNGVIKVWDIAANAHVALAGLEGHTFGVRDIKAAAAGSMVLSGSGDRTVRLWDLRTGSRCVRTWRGIHSAWRRWTGTPHSRQWRRGQHCQAVGSRQWAMYRDVSAWQHRLRCDARVREQLPHLCTAPKQCQRLGRGQHSGNHAGGHGTLLRA